MYTQVSLSFEYKFHKIPGNFYYLEIKSGGVMKNMNKEEKTMNYVVKDLPEIKLIEELLKYDPDVKEKLEMENDTCTRMLAFIYDYAYGYG